MSKKFFSGILVGLFFFFTVPNAQAADIPVLTWERGKVQNVVVGNSLSQGNWHVELDSGTKTLVTFKASTVNAKGFRVFSGELPADLPLGEYSIYVFDGSSKGIQIAQVKVITLSHFNILDSSHEVGLFGIGLTFLLVFLSTLKAKRHSYIRYFRQNKLVDDGTILYSSKIPRFAYKFYLIRVDSLKSLKPSLFKFLLEFDDTFLHKISPLLWTFVPTIGLAAGVQGGLVTGHNSLKFPIYSLLIIASIGMLDAYSGIFALGGYAVAQIIMGEVMNVRAILVIAALGLAWAGTSLLASHMFLSVRQDFIQLEKDPRGLLKRIKIVIGTSCASAIFFLFCMTMAESISNSLVMNRLDILMVSIFVGVISAIKYSIHESLDTSIIREGESEKLEDSHYLVNRIFSPFWTGLIVLSTFFGMFVWSENWLLAAMFGLLNLIFFALLIFRLETHTFKYVLSWERSIIAEPFLLSLLSYLLFLYIDRLPSQTSERSIIFMIAVYVIAILHNLLGNVLDISKKPIKVHHL